MLAREADGLLYVSTVVNRMKELGLVSNFVCLLSLP